MIDDILASKIQSLENKNEDDLYDIIGAFALSQDPEDLRASLAADKKIDTNKIRQSGKQFLKKIKPIIKDALCGTDGLVSYMEHPTVKDVVLVVLPTLGFANLGVAPTALIAVCWIIARSGLRQFCKE